MNGGWPNWRICPADSLESWVKSMAEITGFCWTSGRISPSLLLWAFAEYWNLDRISGQGLKNHLPSDARPRWRFVWCQVWNHKIFWTKIRQQLDKAIQQLTDYTLGEWVIAATWVRLHSRLIELAKGALKGISVLPTSAGTGPMHTVYAPWRFHMAAFGLGNANSRDHGGDENVKLLITIRI